MKIFLKVVLIIILIISIVFTYYFASAVYANFQLDGVIDWQATGQVGDFVGGVIGTLIATIGFILIYLSFASQTNSQKEQKEQFLKSQIESRYFELIKLHKENLLTLSYANTLTNEKLESRKVIDFVFNQFLDCYREITPFFIDPNSQPIYLEEYFDKTKAVNDERTAFDMSSIAHIDIAYSVVFFGTSKDDIGALVKLFSAKYDQQFISAILRYISLKPLNEIYLKDWKLITSSNLPSSLINELINKYNSIKTLTSLNVNDPIYLGAFQSLLQNCENLSLLKYYGGHQYKLGHYFRHLYQTTKYINEKKILSYDEKYDYIKTLRAQLSTIEQYLIFFNSLSFMGRAWELEHVRKGASGIDVNKWLITKYNFIKNIPDLYLLDEISLVNYYPDVHFEFVSQPTTRQDLIKNFI